MGGVIGCWVGESWSLSSCRRRYWLGSYILWSLVLHWPTKKMFKASWPSWRLGHELTVSILNTRQLSQSWQFENAARADFYTQHCHCYHAEALSRPHSLWYKSVIYLVRSLRYLHSLRPSALGCINSIETCTSMYNLYRTLAKEGPWAVHLTMDQDWGGGAIFEVSVSRLYAKEHPGKLPTLSS